MVCQSMREEVSLLPGEQTRAGPSTSALFCLARFLPTLHLPSLLILPRP